MEKWLLRLAAELLREYGERLSNDGCNDYTLPEWADGAALLEAMPPDFAESPDPDLLRYNWAVVELVAAALESHGRH